MKEPYISACGMVSVAELRRTHEALGEGAQKHAVYGIQISPKTLLGGVNRRGIRWYPRGPEALRYLCVQGAQEKLGRLAVHVNFDSTIPEHVSAMTELVLSTLKEDSATQTTVWALQLNNLDWTRHDWSSVITKVRAAGAQVILQANTAACETDPAAFARALRHNEPDYVLLDSSGGTGTQFSALQYARIIEALQQSGLHDIAVAGGLGPDSLAPFAWLCERFGPLSCDAETNLRTDYRSDMPDLSSYSPTRAANYITQAYGLIAASAT